MQSLNMEKTATPVMPAVFPAAPLSNVMEGQTFNTAISNTTAPVQVQNHDAFNHSGNNSVNTIFNNDGFENAVNLGEGNNGSNPNFDEMPSFDEIDRFIQELNASGVNIWDD